MSPSSVVALIVTFPSAIAVTLPVASTDAILLSLELHATTLFVAFSGATVASSTKSSPTTIVVTVGLIDTPVTLTILSTTVTLQVAVFLPVSAVAVTTASPGFTAVTIATPGVLEVHTCPLSGVSAGVKEAISLSVLPFSNVNSLLFSAMSGITTSSLVSSLLQLPANDNVNNIAIAIKTYINLPFDFFLLSIIHIG